MKAITRSIGKRMFDDYVQENFDVMSELIDQNTNAKFVDLGCADGTITKKFAKKIGTNNIYGIEVYEEEVKSAKTKGIRCVKGDLNKKLPYKSNYFDVAISHYSIDHLVDISGFISESYRILKPGGYIIVASDNLNSWLNIIAMILTFQPFSLTRGLASRTIGNPFAYWTNDETQDFKGRDEATVVGAGSHIKVMSTRAAVEAFKDKNFSRVLVRGAGYFPLFSNMSRIMSKIDPYHSHFYILKAVKSK